MKPDVTELWASHRGGSARAREALVRLHLPLVRHFARRMLRRLDAMVGLEDLVSAGTVGLLDAVDAYDPARGTRFSTFAAARIRGAMLDDLRRRDAATRSLRRRQRHLARAEQVLGNRLSRRPSHAEVAEAMEVDEATLWRWKDQLSSVVPMSLNQPLGVDGTTALAETVGDEDAAEIEARLGTEQELALVRAAVAALPERERLVLALYHYEGLKLGEIAEVLGVTESRVSQIRTAALRTLRERLGTTLAAA